MKKEFATCCIKFDCESEGALLVLAFSPFGLSLIFLGCAWPHWMTPDNKVLNCAKLASIMMMMMTA
jgi:hypothetical protein